ncbi:MAG: inorganic diphosphatase [Bacteriovoracaceae bacterium]|nr:inorganic diphosphatase [Bacteriovoracaceae bacterium]
MNPWHDIDLEFDGNTLTCLIEIPAGTKIKYEIDKKTGLLKVDRILYSSVHYPCNYGLFPQTFCDDGDPLDVLVIGQLPVVPLSLMKVRPIGVIRMIDQGEGDDKVISVHVDDPEYNHIKSIKEVAPHKINEIRRFFESYKELEKKSVEIRSIDDEKEAIKVIHESIAFYKKTFK